jgi:hypothetical protein
MPSNDKVLEEGLLKAKKIIYQSLWRELKSLSVELIRRAVEDYDGCNLTGNTITSISAGIYERQMPYPIILNAMDVVGLREPIWHKFSAPGLWVGEDYDGEERKGFEANIKTDQDFGYNTSYHFLLNYKLPANTDFGIVVCTGTEYSEYLTREEDLAYDVLIGAHKAAPMMAENHWKRIRM